jgi:hypothetical protein
MSDDLSEISRHFIQLLPIFVVLYDQRFIGYHGGALCLLFIPQLYEEMSAIGRPFFMKKACHLPTAEYRCYSGTGRSSVQA